MTIPNRVAFKEAKESDRPTRSVARDEEIARQLEVELHEEVESERQREEQASLDYIENLCDEVQERLDADHELVKMNEKATDVHKKKVLEDLDNTKVLKMKARKKAGKQTHADDESSDKGMDSLKKRKAVPRMKRMSKRQKTDADLKEEEHLKTFLKIASDEEEVVDYEVLEKRFPIISWESKLYYFDRHRAEVHILILEDDIEIHMLAEKRYPLTTKTLERMLSLRLIVGSASNAAYDLLRFIQKKIDKSGGYDRGEKDL
nr:hypothetical protein [Tanacetum cinerariifolium]